MTRRLSLLIPAVLLLAPQTVLAQLDPLLFLKRTESNVLILMDTSERMQRDGDENYHDPNIYQKKNKSWEAAIGINATNTNQYYRRKYVWLLHKNSSEKFEANRIVAVGDLDSGYATFEARTRLSVARTALITAVKQNLRSVRWGLVRTRQSSPQVGAEGSSSVKIVDDDAQEAASDSSSGASGIWQLTRGTVAGLNGANTVVTAPLVSPTAADQNARVLEILPKNVRQAGALIPAGGDQYGVVDAPIDYLLEDARIEAQKLVVDPECRNTAVILVTGGSEGNSVAGANPVGTAAKFLDVLGRRVPIYVIAVVPHPGDIAQLKAIAAASGGVYTEITKAMIEAVAAGTAVPEIVRAVNAAVQKTFVDSTTFSVAPSVTQPLGPGQEFQVTSPIVGTANLENATDITGTALENSVIFHPVTDTKIPQRSNLMVTTGFELPGFLGRLRGFRVYKPVEDETKPSGYKFVQAGTRLWVASVPEAASRNIHTTLPDGTMIAFDESNAAVLATYLRTSVADAPALINFIRSQPLGAIVGSTPAIMDPPSLDPPPDSEYPAFVEANKDRRSVVWVGANDGMLHGFDARLGVEVWAYIPFNLLPKLRLLALGQPIDRFSYFVDSSPKVADVKVAGKWRTYLVIGEGPGGTFYQTFDVTLPKIADAVAPASDNLSDVLAYFKSPDQVPLKWSFPRLSSFDHSFGQWGDLKDSASEAELTVGETWSDPAIGQIESGLGPHTVLVASGFLKYSVQQQANRKGMVAGNSFYLLDAETGNMLASQSVGSDGKAEKVDDCRWPTVTINDNDPTTNSGDENTISGGKADAKANCEQIKNALQADPVATGPVDSRYITKVYLGDLDGRLWRFDVGLDEAKKPKFKAAPTKLLDASASKPMFTSMATVTVGTQQYLFQATGSDLLPSDGVTENYDLRVVLDEGASGKLTAQLQLEMIDSKDGEEKVTGFPAVAGDIVFFSTSTFKSNVFCGPNVDAHLYAFTFIGGPAYDTNNDGKLTKTDSLIVRTTTGVRASAPFIVDQHVAFAAGGTVELFGDPEDFNNGVGQAGVRVLSWREVR